jgi:predicted Ser/Thr protein kinase
MDFRMDFFKVIDEQEKKWQDLVDKYIGDNCQLVSCSSSSVQRRIYEKDQVIYKIVLTEENLYENSIQEEFEILHKLKHLKCTPNPISVDIYGECSILSIKKYHGEHISQFGDLVSRNKASIFAIAKAILALNFQGLRHGDIHIQNLLFLPSGAVKILDYDQAIFTTPLKAFWGDFVGIGKFPAKGCAMRLFVQLILSKLPSFLRRYLKIGAFVRRRRFEKSSKELSATDRGSNFAEIWRQAMVSDSNAPGNRICYYSLNYKDSIYLGERSWEVRWKKISEAVNFKGKKMLELGCNLGLLSCYAQYSGALPGGLAIDKDPKIISAARDMAQFASVNVRFQACDFDSEGRWEEEIDMREYDIVSALSVLNWLKDKNRFLTFLGCFHELLYEGHDSIAIEVSRLNSVGFCNISIVTVSERGRVVLLAKKIK